MNTFDKIDFTLRKEGYFPSIARWKIFNDEESELAKKADESFEWKVAYVNYYKGNDPVYYNNGMKYVEQAIARFAGNITQEEHDKLVVDMIYSLHRFGSTFEEYFLFDYFKLNTEGRSAYITDKIRHYLYNKLNLDCNTKLFADKYEAYKAFSKYYKRKIIKIETVADFDIFKEFISGIDKFIVKPIDLSCGRGIKIYNKADYNDPLTLFNEIRGGGISIIEELIMQAKELAAFHPNSVNTIRMPVVKSKDSKTLTIFHPFFKMGRGHSIVDNGGAGGIFACVDAESGIINTEGVDEFSDNEYIFHPDTHYQIVGFKIPRWDEAIELAKEASCQTTNRYTGWDLALTEQGWVIVEGNECGQFIAQQIGKGGQLDELLHLIEQ